MNLRCWLRVALLATPLLGSCTFLSLDEFSPPRCTTNSQCEVLNTQSAIPASACFRFQCARQERTCRLLPRDNDSDGDPAPGCGGGQDCDENNPRRVHNAAAARALCGGTTTDCCDGVDNDCDGVIDEGQWRSGAPLRVGAPLEGVATVSSATRANGAPAILYTTQMMMMRTASFGFASGADTFGPIRYQRQYLPFPESAVTLADDTCPVFDTSGAVASSTICTFGDVVATPADPAAMRWFMAGVSPGGCSAGQLRVGHYDEASRRFVLSDAFSNIATGVNVTPSNPCTSASRMPVRNGASRPTLAALEGRTPRALLVWLAKPLSETVCDAVADVEMIGTWLRTQADVTGTPRFAVRGTDGGRSVFLGSTRGSGRPAVAATVGTPGFIVGYGAATGVALHFVPAFDESASMPALDVARSQASFLLMADGPIDQVVVAPGPPLEVNGGPGVHLGVAWKAGCGGAGSVWFARVRFSQQSPSGSLATPPVQLARGNADLPSLAYVQSGFVQPGFARNGMTATQANSGGWVVTWVEDAGGSRRVAGRRVLELDGQPLMEDSVLIAEGLGGEVYQAVHAAATTGRLVSVLHSSRDGALAAGELLCGR